MRLIHYIFLSWIILTASNLGAQPTHSTGIKEIHLNGVAFFPPFRDLTLQPNDDDLSIYFIDTPAIEYYQFQLVGLDEKPFTSQYPYTRYTNLSGDNYLFRLSTIQGRDTSSTFSLPIKVLPKATEATWFLPALVLYLALIVFAIAFFWLMYHYRQKMRVERIRNQIAGDLHDEVGSTLSSIAIFSKALKRNIKDQNPESVSTLDQIIEAAEETNSNLHDTVWSLNPNLDRIGDLYEKLRSFAFQVFTAKNIELIFDANLTEVKNIRISMLQRNNVYLMIREAITNIVKHSEATQVLLSIKKDGRKVKVKIQDNGKGLAEGVAKGNGLKSLERRAKESFIQYNLKTRIGEGTTITLMIPPL